MGKDRDSPTPNKDLKVSGTDDEATPRAIKRVLARQLVAVMKNQDLSKTDLARRIGTTRAQLDRLLDPNNDSVTLATLTRAAQAVGGHLHVELARPLSYALPQMIARGRKTVRVNPSDISLFVPADAVYPGVESTEQTLLDLLATLSRDETLLVCGRVNTIVTGPGDFDYKGRQQQALNLLCSREEIDRINVFAKAHNTAGPPAVFFRGQLLELMRWTVRYSQNLPGDGQTFLDPAVRSRFVKAALIASMLWSRQTYADRLSGDDDVDTARKRALGAFRKGIEETNLGPHLGVTLGRGWLLFSEYFPRHYPGFHDEFLRVTGLTLEQYFTCVTALSTYTIFNKPDGPVFNSATFAAATAYRDVFAAYLRLEAQNPVQLAPSLWKDFPKLRYRAIRDRPVLITDDARAVVLDPTFFSESITAGPLFHLMAHADDGKRKGILGAFGVAFEDYANDVLRRMYPTRQGLVQRLHCNVEGRDAGRRLFEIDAVINDVTELVIFEMKAAWLRDDAILDDAKLINHIRAKYGVAPDGAGQDRPQGVAQLARIIGAITRGEWSGEQGEFASAQLIYPVLVVHDTRMDAPLYGDFLDKDFVVALGAIPAGKRVAPLTVITIKELEHLESSVDKFSLRNLLADYTKACPDRVRSLHNFMAYSDYGKKIAPSAKLIEASTVIVERAQRELFPRTKETNTEIAEHRTTEPAYAKSPEQSGAPDGT
jgi:DNA-binding Xre family transcriptional regulator